jgi:sterol desaturase/sphingolipid hydroxylase (fatty acid hydroxylase superfamily)
MPSKSGISHTFAALVAVALSPLLERLISELINADDVTAIIDAFGTIIARYPQNPFGNNATTTALQLLTLTLLTFLWGYAYHVSRHQ